DLARYLGESVSVEGERLRKLPVSGMVITSTPETFLRSLPDLLPVRVDKAAGGRMAHLPAWLISVNVNQSKKIALDVLTFAAVAVYLCRGRFFLFPGCQPVPARCRSANNHTDRASRVRLVKC
ncbi:MAG: hypothetical protein RR014_01940, partial [Bilophila sp.]